MTDCAGFLARWRTADAEPPPRVRSPVDQGAGAGLASPQRLIDVSQDARRVEPTELLVLLGAVGPAVVDVAGDEVHAHVDPVGGVANPQDRRVAEHPRRVDRLDALHAELGDVVVAPRLVVADHPLPDRLAGPGQPNPEDDGADAEDDGRQDGDGGDDGVHGSLPGRWQSLEIATTN